MKENLLFLCHRIPYPPNKGDKIRTFHVLKYLSRHYNVYLAAFVDEMTDFQYEKNIAEYCVSHKLVYLNKSISKLKSLSGFIKGTALGLPYFFDPAMKNWVNKTLNKNNVRNVLVASSTMAQYVFGTKYENIHRYIDFIDIDSDKWAQYSKKSRFPMNFLYAYEAKKLFQWEKSVAKEYRKSFFVSQQEAETFKTKVPALENKISYFNNGVNTDYFTPLEKYDSPYNSQDKVILFTGAMDYWANVDAVTWFANEIFPKITETDSSLSFYIVGSNPTDVVRNLSQHERIVVTGSVQDIRPYLAYATLVVAPMRIARGIQNKVLEAMAMSKITVASIQAYEGIHAEVNKEIFVADSESEWVKSILKLLKSDDQELRGISRSARDYVINNFSWDSSLETLGKMLGRSVQQ